VQLETDFNAAVGRATDGNYEFILVDDNFGKRCLDELFIKLDKSNHVTPVILLVSNHEHLTSLENLIAKSAGYLEKATLTVDDLDHSIQYAIALKAQPTSFVKARHDCDVFSMMPLLALPCWKQMDRLRRPIPD
jgi:hypothetical protein